MSTRIDRLTQTGTHPQYLYNQVYRETKKPDYSRRDETCQAFSLNDAVSR